MGKTIGYTAFPITKLHKSCGKHSFRAVCPPKFLPGERIFRFIDVYLHSVKLRIYTTKNNYQTINKPSIPPG